MADPDRAVWESILAHLRAHHPNICRQWFSELVSLGVRAGSLGVRAQSDLHRDYLRRDGLDAFNDAIGTVTGQLIPARFLGPGEPWDAPTPDSPSLAPSAPRRSERLELGSEGTLPITPDNGFDTFVVGPNNQLAHAAALGVCESPGSAYNPLFIHGGVGLGKTHLLQAVCLELHQRDPETRIHYISCDAFLTRFMECVKAGQMPEFRDTFREVDVLVIDDIHFLANRDRTQEEFFHTFNALYQAGKQIVLSSDAAPEEIPHLEERLVSRFGWGLVAKVDKPGFETRVEILKRKAEMRGVTLPDDVACHVAHVYDAHIRQLEGAISKLLITSSVLHHPIDLAMAREAIGERPFSGPPAGPTIETIIAAVTDFYAVKKTELLGKRRHKSIALPRHVCMYLARAHTRHSLEEIGVHFGGRDHTTVMHAVRTVEARREGDPEFAAVVTSLESRLARPAPGREP